MTGLTDNYFISYIENILTVDHLIYVPPRNRCVLNLIDITGATLCATALLLIQSYNINQTKLDYKFCFILPFLQNPFKKLYTSVFLCLQQKIDP